MSPAQSRWFFVGFAVVMAVVTVNAMRQPSRVAATASVVPPKAPVKASPAAVAEQPAAKRPEARAEARAEAKPEPKTLATREAPPPPKETASSREVAPTLKLATVGEPVRVPTRLPTATMVGQLPLPSVTDGDSETIRSLQKELVDAGYGPIVVNGIAGPLTRAAIMAFEHDLGLPLTGEASARRLTQVRAGKDAKPPTADADARRIVTQEAEQVVIIVQKSLQTLGHKVAVDGRLGDETRSAIRAVETEAQLTLSGRIGAGLFGALGRAVARAKSEGG